MVRRARGAQGTKWEVDMGEGGRVRARRGCEGGGKERRRVVEYKETRTPGGKNGSARVRKEIYGRWRALR